MAASLLIVLVGYKFFLFTTFDPEVARYYGVPTGWADSMLALVLAATIVVSIQVLGVTMIAAAIVIPPIVARLLTNSFGTMMMLSAGVGAFCGMGGIYLSYYVDVSSGATVVLFSAALFILTMAYTGLRARLATARGRAAGRASLPDVESGAFH